MTEAEELAHLHTLRDALWGDSWWGTTKTASPTSSVPQGKIPKDAASALRDKIEDGHWTGGTNSDGYPKVKIDGKSELAAHVLLKLRGTTLKPGQIVMHRDNNPLNLRPGNLVVGTQRDNLRQMRDEGRDRPRGVHQEPDVKTAFLQELFAKLADFSMPSMAQNDANLALHENRIVENTRRQMRSLPGYTQAQLKYLSRVTPIGAGAPDPMTALTSLMSLDSQATGKPLLQTINDYAYGAGFKPQGYISKGMLQTKGLHDLELSPADFAPKPAPAAQAPAAPAPASLPQAPVRTVNAVPRPVPGAQAKQLGAAAASAAPHVPGPLPPPIRVAPAAPRPSAVSGLARKLPAMRLGLE